MSVIPDPSKFLRANPIVPVVVIDDADDAVAAGEALLAGGIGCAEVTFRTDAAARAIELMSGVDGMTVGAGTILNAQQAREAIGAGAKFLVSPGWSASVAEVAAETGVPYLPGLQTATEIMMALEYGAKVVKFFPGGEAGGLKMVKALAGPFPTLKFMPSGGVSPANLEEWITDPAIISVSGSWMIKRDFIKNHEFDKIAELSAEASARVKELLS